MNKLKKAPARSKFSILHSIAILFPPHLVSKITRTGLAAGTVAQSDPVLVNQFRRLGQPVGARFPTNLERGLIASAWRNYEDGLAGGPPHPLLRLTREQYPENSLEGKPSWDFWSSSSRRSASRARSNVPRATWICWTGSRRAWRSAGG